MEYKNIIYNTIMVLNNIMNEYLALRASIPNDNNGKAKIGCVAFSPKLNHQCVLCFWT